jgi:protein SCO1/2
MKLRQQSIWLLTLLLVSVPVVVFGIVQWYQHRFDRLPVLGGYDINQNGMPVKHAISSFEFKNQDNQLFSSESVGSRILVVNFFFTSCAGICPNMMKHVKKVQEYFNNDSNLFFISITVDPNRDSAARLKWYASQYDIESNKWSLLTGNKKEIYKLARKSFYLSANEGDGGENDFIHSEQLVLVDKNKHIRGYYDGTDNDAMEKLKFDIKKLEYEN